MEETLTCPACGADMGNIGCEKTTICADCQTEWAWDKGMTSLRRVEEGDPIHWDR